LIDKFAAPILHPAAGGLMRKQLLNQIFDNVLMPLIRIYKFALTLSYPFTKGRKVLKLTAFRKAL